MTVKVDQITRLKFRLQEAIENEYEETGVDALPWDHEIPITMRLADDIIKLMESNVIKEPLEDVVFFAGKATNDSMVYHVLCRKETYEQMWRDPNVHFMLIKQFNGTFGPDTAKTLDDQETINRDKFTGRTE